MNTTTHRETWLNNLAALMAPKFAELGWPLQPFRVSIGFTGAPKESNVAGVCWHSSASADKRFEIFITPDQSAAMDVAAILAHELAHAAVGFKHKHKGDFAKCVAALGMVRPFTSSVPGDDFKAWVTPFLEQLGELPHAPLMFRRGQLEKKAAEEGAEEGEGGSSNDKKKQSTRMLKAACTHEHDGKPCGYTVRLSKKWALALGAVCPLHGPIAIDIPVDDVPADEEAAELED